MRSGWVDLDTVLVFQLINEGTSPRSSLWSRRRSLDSGSPPSSRPSPPRRKRNCFRVWHDLRARLAAVQGFNARNGSGISLPVLLPPPLEGDGGASRRLRKTRRRVLADGHHRSQPFAIAKSHPIQGRCPSEFSILALCFRAGGLSCDPCLFAAENLRWWRPSC
jgi:hypothetical protein